MSRGRGRGKSRSKVVIDPANGARTKETHYLLTDTGVWTYETDTEKEIFESLATDTDRAAGIVAGSLIDIRLEAAIRHRLRRDGKVEDALFSVGQPIGTFSAKIDLAYLMGIIGPEARTDAHVIRGIRNSFAHDLSVRGFSSPSIKDRTKQLKLVDTHVVNQIPDVPDQFMFNVSPNAIPRLGVINVHQKKLDPRARYIITCSVIVLGLGHCEMMTTEQLT